MERGSKQSGAPDRGLSASSCPDQIRAAKLLEAIRSIADGLCCDEESASKIT